MTSGKKLLDQQIDALLERLHPGPRKAAREYVLRAVRNILLLLVCDLVLAVILFLCFLKGIGLVVVLAAVLLFLGLLFDMVVVYAEWIQLERVLVDPLEQLGAELARFPGGERDLPPVVAADLAEAMARVHSLLATVTRERELRAVGETRASSQSSLLRQMSRVLRDVSASLDPERTYAAVVQGALRISGFEKGTLWMVDDVARTVSAVCDSSGKPPGSAPVPFADSFAAKAVTSGHSAIGHPYGTAGPLCMAVPLVSGVAILAVLELAREGIVATVDDSAREAVEMLASHAAAALSAIQLHEEVELRGELDGLTRLFNRRRMDADLQAEVTRSLRYGHALTLVMTDVDHFKQVNDTFGHQAGDQVLKGLADALRTHSRETDSIYRYGGEEFAVLLRDTDLSSAVEVADRIRLAVTEHLAQLKVIPDPLTISLGVASVSGRIRTVEALIHAADGALYTAKSSGRNRTVAADPI